MDTSNEDKDYKASSTFSENVVTLTEKPAVVAATPSTKTKSINALRSPIGTISEQLQGSFPFH